MKRNDELKAGKQRGAVLLVSLILLLVLTLIGISTMESTGMEMKMANQSRERVIAMQAAEAGLRAAESFIQQTGFSDSEMVTGCNTGSQNCFDSTCSDGGYCFSGTNGSSWDNCTVGVVAKPIWEDPAVWDTASRHHTIVSAGLQADVKYIIEYRCYIPDTAGELFNLSTARKLFRITALATSASGKSRVMLQSTYKPKLI